MKSSEKGKNRKAVGILVDASPPMVSSSMVSAPNGNPPFYMEVGCDPFKAVGILKTPLEVEEKKQDESSSQKKSRKVRQRGLVVVSCGMVANVIGKGYEGSRTAVEGRNMVQGKVALKESTENCKQILHSLLGQKPDLGLGVVRGTPGVYSGNTEKAMSYHPQIFRGMGCNNSFGSNMAPLQVPLQVFIYEHSSCSLQENYHPNLISEEENISLDIFYTRNQVINNIITIDLHGQHVSEAIFLLKCHLLVFSYIPSIGFLRVITGHGEARVEKGKVKVSVKSFVRMETIDFVEENLGCFLLKIQDKKDYKFITEMCLDGNDWRRIVKMLRNRDIFLHSKSMPTIEQTHKDVRDGYTEFRTIARRNWDLMETYYKRPDMEHSRGNHIHASHLKEMARYYRDLARDEDDRASLEIFGARNEGNKNTITIDLCEQLPRQAIGLLKRHLLLFTCISSVHYLRLIIGCDAHGVGKGDLKQSVKCLVARENIEFTEVNAWMMMLRIEGRKDYMFAAVDSDEQRNFPVHGRHRNFR